MIEFFKENITLTTIIVALILNVFYDLSKSFFIWILKISARIVKAKSNNNILFLIQYYKTENEHIEKIVNKDGLFLRKVAKELINDSIFSFLILITLLVLNNIENRIIFYGTLGSSFIILLKIFANYFYYIKLFIKVKFNEKYTLRNLSRISKLEKLNFSK